MTSASLSSKTITIQPTSRGLTEPPLIRFILIGVGLLFLTVFLVLPLVGVFYEALQKGVHVYFKNIAHPLTRSALSLTFWTTLAVLPLNIVFGLAASWAISRYSFRGKTLLITLIDLPFSISPVIVGLMFVLLFGLHGYLGPWFMTHGIKIIFSFPAILLTTWFVTFPFVARELIPLMQAQGTDEELAGVVLGANGWQIFRRITLPNIKWGLLYGIILSSARAMGEFGAVSVVSGHIRGLTHTVPLHVEILYNEYNFVGAFAVASLLTLLSIFTLILKAIIEKRTVPISSENKNEY